MGKTMDDRWADIESALDDAVGITWDGCHKIYVLMDDEQVDIMRGYGYDVLPVIFVQDSLETLSRWWDDSCGLRFVTAVSSGEGDPNKGYKDLIGQFDDEADDEEDY